MSFWRSLALALALIAAAAPAAGPPALAAPAKAVALSPADASDLKRLEEYLNGLTTLTAGFLQVGPQGGVMRGMFYLQRPGRMRFQYDPPAKVLLVADGTLLIYYDGELDQTSSVPLGSTPVGFLAEKDIRFSGKATVTAFERGANVFRVTVRETDEPDQGALTLTFSDQPLRLEQWSVLDAQNQTTRVTLVNPRRGDTLDRKLFEFVDPRFFRPKEN
jgi:outer membrane lipoprotein-sorting protein